MKKTNLTPRELEQIAKLLAEAVYGTLDTSRVEVDAATLEAALYKINNARPSSLRARLSNAIEAL